MFKYFTYIKNIFEILNIKNKLLLILFFFNSVFMAALDTFSIGILAIYVGFLSNPNLILEKIPIEFLKNYLIELDKLSLVFEVSVVIILAFLLKNLIIVLSNWFSLKIKQSIISDNSNEIFSYILKSDFKDLVDKTKSVLTYKIYSEVKRVASFIVAYNMLLRELLLVVSISITLLYVNKTVFFLILITFLIFLFISIFSLKGLLKKSADKTNKHSSLMLQSLSEILDNFILIKISSKKKFFINKYLNQLNLQIKFNNIKSLIHTLPRNIFEIVGVSIVILFVLAETLKESVNTSELLPVISFIALAAARMIPSFGTMNANFSSIIYNKKTFLDFFNDRKKLILKKSSNILNGSHKNLDNSNDLEIYFDFVNYGYHKEKTVLKNLNYLFKKNFIYGISGKSGSGKSTFIKLVMGLLKPTKGKIYLNGSEINLSENNFKSLIGYVPQKIFLINGSVSANIAMGENKEEINSENIKKSLEMSDLKSIINVADIENFIIAEQGANLSGGQVQMVGVARAIYQDPKILIFDEPTNNLDDEAKIKFTNNLKKISKEKICFIVTHDKDLLTKCDKILLIKDSKIEEK